MRVRIGSRCVTWEGHEYPSRAEFVREHLRLGRAVRRDGILAHGLYLARLAEHAVTALAECDGKITDIYTLPSGALVLETTLDGGRRGHRPLVVGKLCWGRVYDRLRAEAVAHCDARTQSRG